MNFSVPAGRRLLALLLATGGLTAAHAENKLFPTDVLDRGQVDATASLQGFKSRGGGTQEVTDRSVSEGVEVRYGLAPGWHVAGNFSTGSRRVRFGDFLQKDSDLFQGGLSVRHGLVTDAASPWTLSVEAGVQSFKASSLNASASIGSAALNAGFKVSQDVKAHSGLRVSVPNRATSAKQAQLSLGAWIDLGKGLVVDPHVAWVRSSSTAAVTAADQYTAGLSAIVPLASDTYLLPAVQAARTSGVDFKGSGFRTSPSHAASVSLQLHHLFR